MSSFFQGLSKQANQYNLDQIVKKKLKQGLEEREKFDEFAKADKSEQKVAMYLENLVQVEDKSAVQAHRMLLHLIALKQSNVVESEDIPKKKVSENALRPKRNTHYSQPSLI